MEHNCRMRSVLVRARGRIISVCFELVLWRWKVVNSFQECNSLLVCLFQSVIVKVTYWQRWVVPWAVFSSLEVIYCLEIIEEYQNTQSRLSGLYSMRLEQTREWLFKDSKDFYVKFPRYETMLASKLNIHLNWSLFKCVFRVRISF